MQANADGAGFAIETDNGVEISKGFFCADDLWTELQDFYPDWQERNLIIHARIATSGVVNIGNCHPYPVGDDIDELTAMYTPHNMAIAHNGFIAWGGKDELEKYSDTLLFVRDIAAPMYKQLETQDYENMLDCVARSNGCRLATIDKDGITVYGSGWVEDDGIFYSNDSYKKREINANYHVEETDCPQCGGVAVSWGGTFYCQECWLSFGKDEGDWKTCSWCGFSSGDTLEVNGFTFCRDCWDKESQEISHLIGIRGY